MHAKPKPGEFPIGRTESRAAARMLAEQRERAQAQQMFVNPGVEAAKQGRGRE